MLKQKKPGESYRPLLTKEAANVRKVNAAKSKQKRVNRFERRLAERRERELIMTAGKIVLQGMREEERTK